MCRTLSDQSKFVREAVPNSIFKFLVAAVLRRGVSYNHFALAFEAELVLELFVDGDEVVASGEELAGEGLAYV